MARRAPGAAACRVGGMRPLLNSLYRHAVPISRGSISPGPAATGHASAPPGAWAVSATPLQISADCGGGNGNRTRLWKPELQRPADHTDRPSRVCGCLRDSFRLRPDCRIFVEAALFGRTARVAQVVRYRSSSSGRSARAHGSFEWPSRSAVGDPPGTRGQIASRGRLLLRRLEPKGGRIPWPVRSCPSSSSGGASVAVVGRRCSLIGVQKRRLGVDLDGGCSRNRLGERQRDQRGRSGCRRSFDLRELEQRLGLVALESSRLPAPRRSDRRGDRR
jgi:hypothetical protein